MLPRIVASPLFVLLCFWVCTLAVLALPMPTGDSKDTVPVSEHHPPTVLDLELNIIFCNMDTLNEHSMIKIGDTILYATASDTSVPRREVTLKPEQYVFRWKPSKRFFPTQPIGKARFRDEQDVRDAVGEMIEVKLPPMGHRGTCRDYIWTVLQKLRDRGNIVDGLVLETYRKIYNERYEKVFKDYYAKEGMDGGTI